MSIFEESKIFKNEEVLSPEYLPELLPHRENQIKQLANNLFPASKGRKPINTFLFGPPGIGKTACAKFVFREFEDYSGVKTIYINCWDFNTTSAILSKIILDLGFFVQRRGIGKDEIVSRLVEAIEKTKKSLIVCLDEVDQLIFKSQEVLYDLLRIEQYVSNPIGLIFISNNPFIFVNLEPRIKSSLAVEEIEFKSYSLQEMRDILEERVKHAFFEGRVEEGVVLLSANHAIKKGSDVRVGLECLLKAGRVAEREGSDKVRVEHIKKILAEVQKAKPKILKERISEIEKIILNLIEKEELTSGELYKRYYKTTKNPVSERAFRNFVNHLAEINLIKIKRKKGIHGFTRVISKV